MREKFCLPKKNADIINKSENWKDTLFFWPGLTDAEGDFIGQLDPRKGPFFGLGNMWWVQPDEHGYMVVALWGVGPASV